MADLTGVAQGAHWRRYIGGIEPRTLASHLHFYRAALLTSSDDELTGGRRALHLKAARPRWSLDPAEVLAHNLGRAAGATLSHH